MFWSDISLPQGADVLTLGERRRGIDHSLAR